MIDENTIFLDLLGKTGPFWKVGKIDPPNLPEPWYIGNIYRALVGQFRVVPHLIRTKIHKTDLNFLTNSKIFCKKSIFQKNRIVELFNFSSLFPNLMWKRKSLLKIDFLIFNFSKNCKKSQNFSRSGFLRNSKNKTKF